GAAQGIWGGSAELNGPAGPKGGPERAREGRREGTGGPGSPRAVPGGTRLSAARLTAQREHAVHARGRGRDAVHARGPRWTQVRRAHAQPHGSRWIARTRRDRPGSARPGLAELAPTWRLRGCHVGWREVDDDPTAKGRRAAAASGGANHGDTGKSEHIGRLRRLARPWP
ncbi:Os07g0104750, partial [Oryza sativa Japonica Group]